MLWLDLRELTKMEYLVWEYRYRSGTLIAGGLGGLTWNEGIEYIATNIEELASDEYFDSSVLSRESFGPVLKIVAEKIGLGKEPPVFLVIRQPHGSNILPVDIVPEFLRRLKE